MNKLPTSFKRILFCFLFVSISLLTNVVSAQEKAPLSRVAITVDDANTNIWISDFPVKTKVMLVDADDNLLGMLTTNQYGAAFTKLSKPVYTQLTARTLNGELQVVNTAVVKSASSNEPVAAGNKKTGNKV